MMNCNKEEAIKQQRSTQRKHHVNYDDNLSDEEEDASKRFKGVGYSSPTKDSEVQHFSSEESLHNTEHKAENAKGSVDLPLDMGPSTMTESEKIEYAHPNFSDFNKYRKESCFKVGQVWAVYDNLDAMPRFYAAIRKILSPAFKLRITWLEPQPLNEDDYKWLSEGFPASCGRFRLENSEDTEDHTMFSHLVCEMNENLYKAIKIFPLEGETWALFKDWDMNWCPDLGSNNNFNYEFVEILSNYSDSIGVHVAYLNKAKGFTCLFHRVGDPFLVPAKDMFKFSHRVPSIKMTGVERNDVLKGSFELDPASLPTDQADISASSIDQRGITNFTDSAILAERGVSSMPDPVLEPEFYIFTAERSPEKFQIGQCWAIYSDEYALPRYYGQIKKIELLPEFVLHVALFYACPLPKSTIQWHDEKMPIGCGLFMFRNSMLTKYTVTNNFSHVVTTETLSKGVYKIFPRTGEVWAVYKNWSAQMMKGNNLKDFEYEIVEILDVSDNYVDVKFLERVKGFQSVYKAQVEEEEEAEKIVKICVSEHLRFSHRIPAFHLTEERGGSLRGFWELDPAGMPLYLLCTD